MVTRCHSLLLFVPLVFIRCHSLSFVVPLVVMRCATRFTTRCRHSLSFLVTCCTTLCIRCTTRCHSFSLAVIRCHSLWLDVPLVGLFINDQMKLQILRPSYFSSLKSFDKRLETLCKMCYKALSIYFLSEQHNSTLLPIKPF